MANTEPDYRAMKFRDRIDFEVHWMLSGIIEDQLRERQALNQFFRNLYASRPRVKDLISSNILSYENRSILIIINFIWI